MEWCLTGMEVGYRRHRVMNRGELKSPEVRFQGQLTLTSTLFFW